MISPIFAVSCALACASSGDETSRSSNTLPLLAAWRILLLTFAGLREGTISSVCHLRLWLVVTN